MTQGRRRTLIPPAYSDLKQWPQPDPEKTRTDPTFIMRRLAVEMYASGDLQQIIFEVTGKNRGEVRRLVNKCTSLAGDGKIAGFYALLSGWRTKKYERQAVVSHVIGGGSGGCAGALRQLFNRFPEAEEHIQSLFFKDTKAHLVHEARIGYKELHAEFIKKLIELGLGENDWPFNTASRGYQSVRRYCLSLLEGDSGKWIMARSGDEAARRKTIGNGQSSILPQLRGYGAVQLDFHLVDAASIILIQNSFGVDIPITVARWHIGMMVEERWGLVIGVFIALESTPSGDSVLETIETALRPLKWDENDPRLALVLDGKVLPNQLFPELAYQSFSVLKMDNAKSNAAAEVVSNIVDTVGCAVNFGPVKAWWRRDLVERVFGELTRKGLQRLPSTLGSGPFDTRRSSSPNEKAVHFRIMLSDLVSVIYGCVREHNEHRSKSLQQASAIDALKAAMRHPASGFLHLPLPKAAQEDLRLMSHIEEVTVRGNIEKNVRPYVYVGGWRYTSPILAQSYNLIGEKVIAYCDRRAAQLVSITVKETGEQLGWVEPPRQWRDVSISFRERALINRTGEALRHAENGLSSVRRWIHNKNDEMLQQNRNNSKSPRSSKEALGVAKISAKLAQSEVSCPEHEIEPKCSPSDLIVEPSTSYQRVHPSAPSTLKFEVVESEKEIDSIPRLDPFGLLRLPEMRPVDTEE